MPRRSRQRPFHPSFPLVIPLLFSCRGGYEPKNSTAQEQVSLPEFAPVTGGDDRISLKARPRPSPVNRDPCPGTGAETTPLRNTPAGSMRLPCRRRPPRGGLMGQIGAPVGGQCGTRVLPPRG